MLADYLVPGTPACDAYVKWITFISTTGETPGGRYLSERGLTALGRRLGFSSELCALWWDSVRAMRAPEYAIPMTDENGVPFRYTLASFRELVLPVVNADFGPVLRKAGTLGSLPVPAGIVSENLRYEAVASCLLDGVPVERAEALEMLEGGRLPRNRAECAVRNVYTVLRDYVPATRGALTVQRILDLHRALMEGAAEHPEAGGQLRQGGEVPREGGVAPGDIPLPSADELRERLEALCRYVSERTFGTRSEVVDALLAQFWIAHDRPFLEGNGRLARVLYYAALGARWPDSPPRVAGLVSLSATMARIPEAYAGTFRDARADDNDAGYFIHASLRVLGRAIRRMLRSVAGVGSMAEALEAKGVPGLNERQLELLFKARGRPASHITIEAYRRRHGVAYQTARTDLLRLAELGLLEQVGSGRTFAFAPSASLLSVPLAAVEEDAFTAHERPGFSALSALFRG